MALKIIDASDVIPGRDAKNVISSRYINDKNIISNKATKSGYVEIKQGEFEEILSRRGYKWERVTDPIAKEAVYLVDFGGIYVKVYSSIVNGLSRGVGTDAMRIVAWDHVSNLPVISSEGRVNRTSGWRENLIVRIESAKDKMKGVEKCNICGGLLVERTNKLTQKTFMGCLNYRNHPGSKNIDIVHKSVDRNIVADRNMTTGNATGSNIIDSFHNKMKEISDRLNIRLHEVSGNEQLLETKLFQWGKFPMDKFNPIQSELAEFVPGDHNIVVEARTSTGKTVMGEMFMWKVLAEGKKVIYTSPLKALTREKFDSWTKKFGEAGYKLAMVTGDYRLTDKRIKELNDANIILCTSEMLDHRTRNIASEKSEWLEKAGLLILDEIQLIGMKDRGDKLEAGLMRFTKINSVCKMVLLSGTMPNSIEIAGWIRDLNGKDTVLVKSNWRPIKLNMKYEDYDDSGGYYDNKSNMFSKIIDKVKENDKNKILIFVHSKVDGRKLMSILEDIGYPTVFHNADLDSDERVDIEEGFKNKGEGGVRIMIATSTLAYGLNLPARVVIIAGMHRGLEIVSELDIIQECGRSGRMGIDSEGDAIMVFPSSKLDEFRHMVENPGDILSQINNPIIAAFHIIGEIAGKTVKTREDVHKWYIRSLASRQNMEMNKEYVDEIIDYLLKNDAIKEVNGQLEETELGKAAVFFYLRPDMLKDMMVNWSKIFKAGVESNDFIVSLAMSRLRMYIDTIVSKSDRAEIDVYMKASDAMKHILGEINEGQAKIGMSYLNMLKGVGGMKNISGADVPNHLIGIQRMLSQDIERTMQAMMYIDAKYAHWEKGTYWNGMAMRFKYGIGPELISLCRLEGIGGVLAKKLWIAGIRQPTDLVTKRKESMMALGTKYYGIIAKNQEMFHILGYDIKGD